MTTQSGEGSKRQKHGSVSFKQGNIKITLPKYCECGGLLVYSFEFGRIFNYCKKCTPCSIITPTSERLRKTSP